MCSGGTDAVIVTEHSQAGVVENAEPRLKQDMACCSHKVYVVEAGRGRGHESAMKRAVVHVRRFMLAL